MRLAQYKPNRVMSSWINSLAIPVWGSEIFPLYSKNSCNQMGPTLVLMIVAMVMNHWWWRFNGKHGFVARVNAASRVEYKRITPKTKPKYIGKGFIQWWWWWWRRRQWPRPRWWWLQITNSRKRCLILIKIQCSKYTSQKARPGKQLLCKRDKN